MCQQSHAVLFRTFANRECRGSSALYECLASRIAEDNEVLELAAHAQPGQPIPNMLLGAVHCLLLQGYEHPLRTYYPSIVEQPEPVEQAFSAFTNFCRHFRSDIISILQTKHVQTNEVRRCAYLYPAFCFIYNTIGKPLALIEIGTSAGLQLLWDQYAYSYGTNLVYGNINSPLQLHAEIRGGGLPILLRNSPPIAARVGIDLHTMDVSDADDYLWLRSLIWPEHAERVRLFEKAAEYVKQQPPVLLEGDGAIEVANISAQMPNDTAICIFHTHVANQIPDQVKHKLVDTIRHIGATRDVFHLYNNMWDRNLHLDYYIDGVEYNVTVGETEGHGRWFTWQL